MTIPKHEEESIKRQLENEQGLAEILPVARPWVNLVSIRSRMLFVLLDTLEKKSETGYLSKEDAATLKEVSKDYDTICLAGYPAPNTKERWDQIYPASQIWLRNRAHLLPRRTLLWLRSERGIDLGVEL